MVVSSLLMNVTAVSKNDTSVTGNSTSAISYEWEYYYDYLDPVIVDESKLKYNKCKFLNITFLNSALNVSKILSSFSDSIVIVLWISLAAFVGFLFLSLNLMSMRGKLPK